MRGPPNSDRFSGCRPRVSSLGERVAQVQYRLGARLDFERMACLFQHTVRRHAVTCSTELDCHHCARLQVVHGDLGVPVSIRRESLAA